MTADLIVAAILAIFPHMSGNNRRCIENNRRQIAANLAETHRAFPALPMEVMASVAFLETHLGCDAGEGGNWGAPVSARRRHVAGTPMQAARIMAQGIQQCRSMEGAIRRFRTGFCNPRRQTRRQDIHLIADRYLVKVFRLVEQIHQRR